MVLKVLGDLVFGVADAPAADAGEAEPAALALALDRRDGAVERCRNIFLVEQSGQAEDRRIIGHHAPSLRLKHIGESRIPWQLRFLREYIGEALMQISRQLRDGGLLGDF